MLSSMIVTKCEFIFLFSFFFFPSKTYNRRMQFREVLVIIRNMFNGEMVNVEGTKKTAFLEEMIDINVPTLKFQSCPKNTYMYVGWTLRGGENDYRRTAIPNKKNNIIYRYLIECKYLPLRNTLNILHIGFFFISSLVWMSRLIFPNTGTYVHLFKVKKKKKIYLLSLFS